MKKNSLMVVFGVCVGVCVLQALGQKEEATIPESVVEVTAYDTEYLQPRTVVAQVERLGLADLILFDQTVRTVPVMIWWNQSAAKLEVMIDGTDDLIVWEEDDWRIRWAAKFVRFKNGRFVSYLPTITGVFFSTDDGFILEVEADGQDGYRAQIDGMSIEVVSNMANCVCWTRPPKGTCTNTQCDNGDGCAVKGSPDPNATCTWRATAS